MTTLSRALLLSCTSLALACASGGTGSTEDDGDDGGDGGDNTMCGLPAPDEDAGPRPDGDVGELLVLDWAGFTAAASYTFDDANQTQIDHYDALQALGIPMTFYLQTNKRQAGDPIWAQALEDGHELGNHTHSHPQEASAEDIDEATTFIEETFGVRPWTMAAPYGDASYQPLAEERFLINRGVNNRTIAPNDSTNPFNLPCYLPPEGADAETMASQIESAREGGAWRVVLVHGFTGGSDGAYQPVDIEAFTESVELAKEGGGVWFDTVMAIGAYWRAQKLISEATPEESDGAYTWSWELPENFPPGQCVRVRPSGGTVEQDGQEVAWNDRGYFEIALDAGSVTVRPE